MYNGIGLQTPRGSGTNGYIQTNRFHVKPRQGSVRVDYNSGAGDGSKLDAPIRKPNKDIIDHDRKRQIEVRLLGLQDELEDRGYTAAEMAEMLAEARKKYEAESAEEASQEAGGGGKGRPPLPNQRFSDTQTHHSAARKEILSAKFKEILDAAKPRQRYHIREDGPRKLTSDEGNRTFGTDEHKRDDKDDSKGKYKDDGSKSNAKYVERGTNKLEKSTHRLDSEDETDIRSIRKSRSDVSKKQGDRKKVEAYNDNLDSDSDEDDRKGTVKHSKKHKRHDTDSDSEYAHKKVGEHNSKENTRRAAVKHSKNHRRHDKDSHSEDEKHKILVRRQSAKNQRHDSESSESDTSESYTSEAETDEDKKSRKGLEKRKGPSRTYNGSDSVTKNRNRTSADTKHEKRRRHYSESSEDDGDGDRRNGRNVMDRHHKRRKCNDSDTESEKKYATIKKQDDKSGQERAKGRRHYSEF